MPRFVILYHEFDPNAERLSHFDLMLEDDGKLLTWELPELPSGKEIACRQLADHRLSYLTYEGPISNDRGQVTRHDSGKFEWLSREDEAWVAKLSGEKKSGRLTLTRGGEGWLCSFDGTDSYSNCCG